MVRIFSVTKRMMQSDVSDVADDDGRKEFSRVILIWQNFVGGVSEAAIIGAELLKIGLELEYPDCTSDYTL